jgi:hypothetical protein
VDRDLKLLADPEKAFPIRAAPDPKWIWNKNNSDKPIKFTISVRCEMRKNLVYSTKRDENEWNMQPKTHTLTRRERKLKFMLKIFLKSRAGSDKIRIRKNLKSLISIVENLKSMIKVLKSDQDPKKIISDLQHCWQLRLSLLSNPVK